MEEKVSARNPGGDEPRIPPGHDYEYDEAHDVIVGAIRETPAPHRVDAPVVDPGVGGDYGYDEAHDFCARRSTPS